MDAIFLKPILVPAGGEEKIVKFCPYLAIFQSIWTLDHEFEVRFDEFPFIFPGKLILGKKTHTKIDFQGKLQQISKKGLRIRDQRHQISLDRV